MSELEPTYSREKVGEQKILPVEFTLPDLSKLKPQEHSRYFAFTFPIEYRGEKFYCKIDFERSADLEDRPDTPYTSPLKIRLEGYDENPSDSNPFKYKFTFLTYLIVGDFPHFSEFEDTLANQPFWDTAYRMVDESQRGKGFGELALRIIKEITQKISEETDLKGNYININTSLSSLARLIVDQNWLKEQNLAHLAKKSNMDLKFIPQPADEANARELLQGSTLDTNDAKYSNTKNVKFICKLDS